MRCGRRSSWAFATLLFLTSVALAVPPMPPVVKPTFPIPPPISAADQAKLQEISRTSRAARQAETAGDFAHALELWKTVIEQRPGDFSAYGGIKHCLENLKRFDEALAFLDKTLATATRGTSGIDAATVSADRVEVLFAAGRTKDADAEIERVVSANRGYLNLYRDLSNVLYAQSRPDDAVALLKRGRRETGQPYLFAREIAQFAEARMDWGSAVTEYLLYLAESPDRISFVTGALGDILLEPGGDTLVVNGISAQLKDADPTQRETLLELQAGLLFRAQRYEEALSAYQQLDQMHGGTGTELLDLAGRLADEGQLELALKSYALLLTRNPQPDVRCRALIGKTRAAERLGWLDSARVACEAVLNPGSPLGAIVEANYRLGRITLQQRGSTEEARSHFEAAAKIIKQSPTSAGPFAEPILIQLAITYELDNQLERAKQEIKNLVKAVGSRGGAASEARMELARLAFRQGDLESAGNEANALLAADAGSPSSNEAVELLALLDKLKETPDALKILGQADMLHLLHKEDEATRLLDSLAASGSTPLVREEALWKGWELATEMNLPREALSRIERIVALGLTSLKRDKAILEAGILYQELGDLPRASASFDSLLREYPDSPLANQARKLAKSIHRENS